jgi:hypothetical protein
MGRLYCEPFFMASAIFCRLDGLEPDITRKKQTRKQLKNMDLRKAAS